MRAAWMAAAVPPFEFIVTGKPISHQAKGYP